MFTTQELQYNSDPLSKRTTTKKIIKEKMPLWKKIERIGGEDTCSVVTECCKNSLKKFKFSSCVQNEI